MQFRPIHPFPARMAPELALAALNELPTGSVVLDPMAGSGTVLRQAIALGHRAIGFDTDPLAVLMARVWTTGVTSEDIHKECRLLLEEAATVNLRIHKLPWVASDHETSEFIRYWFGDEQRRALHRIAYILHRRRKARLGRRRRAAVEALTVALSRIIVTKEPCASLARDTSHSRPHRVIDTSDFDVLSGFQRSVSIVAERISSLSSDHHGLAHVEQGDARDVPLRASAVDAVVTSPPYLNAIDYMRGHRLSLVWFGFQLRQLRRVRGSSIGAERASESTSKTIDSVCSEMVSIKLLPRRFQAIVQRYACDLIAMTTEIARVLKKDGVATLVVGNSCLRDVFVRNADGVYAAAALCGMEPLRVAERELPAGSRYLPITTSGMLSKRMRTETVLTFGKRR